MVNQMATDSQLKMNHLTKFPNSYGDLTKADSYMIKLSTSPGYLRLTTSILVGMETHRFESLVITGPYRSGCLFWVLKVLATSTCQTMVFLFFT